MKNVLVVEDTPAFQDIYRKYVEKFGAYVIITGSLKEAQRAIEMFAFDVALIDIRLDEKDDENVDGLRVLEILVKKDDGTRAIVITGYGTLKIAREAFVQYGAVDVVDKGELNLGFFYEQLKKELENVPSSNKKRTIMDWYVLKSETMNVLHWESQILNICNPGGIEPLHNLFDILSKELSPLIAANPNEPMKLDTVAGICSGVFWTRRKGMAVLLVLANEEKLIEIQNNINNVTFKNISPLLTSKVGNMEFEKRSKKMIGMAYALPDVTWEIFKDNCQTD
jgi:CheY-like chemotaxis protein